MLAEISMWLSTHGFQLNSREWASIFWMAVLAVFALSKPDIRSDLLGVLRRILHRKIATVFLAYIIWIISFVLFTDWLGIWRPVLTKTTFVWGGTTGVVLLFGITDVNESGYFLRTAFKIAGIIVIVEYIVNLATFHILIEIVLQLLITLVMVAPIVVKEPEYREMWQRIRVWFSFLLMVVVSIHTIRTFQATWNQVDLSLLILRAVWPMILGLWVLVFVFALAVITSYE